MIVPSIMLAAMQRQADAAGAAITTIDLSGTKTQAMFDIDMTGYDTLDVWIVDYTTSANLLPKARGSNDGGLNYKVAAGDYRFNLFRFNEEHLGTFIPYTGTVGLNSNKLNAYARFSGFNKTNNGVGLMSGHASSPDNSFDRADPVCGVMTFNNISHIRIGTLAEFGGSVGTLRYIRSSYAASGEIASVDFSATNSLTYFHDVTGYDEVWFRGKDIRDGRLMTRVSLNGTTFLTSTIYHTLVLTRPFTTISEPQGFHSLDSTAFKYPSPFVFMGLNDGAWTGEVMGGTGLYDDGSPQVGYVKQTSQITHIGFAEFDDATNYIGGDISGVGYTWNAKLAGVTSVAAAATEFIVDLTGDYNYAQFISAAGITTTVAESAEITFSINNGVSYINSDYIVGRGGQSVFGGLSSWVTNLTSLTNTHFHFQMAGIQAGVEPFIFGGFGGNPSTPILTGIRFGDTSKVTHMKVKLPTGNFNGGFDFTWRKWR